MTAITSLTDRVSMISRTFLILAVVGVGFGLAADTAKAVNIDQNDAVLLGNGNTYLDTIIKCDDSGAEYDSLDITMYEGLSEAIFALPHNQITYASKDDMTDSWLMYALPTGEVWDGWYPDTHVAIGNKDWGNISFDKYPPADVWNSDSNSDEMIVTLKLPTSQLGDNYELVIDRSSTVPGVVAHTSNIHNPTHYADSHPVNVQAVPEPMTMTLLALSGLPLLAKRRRRVLLEEADSHKGMR